MRALFWVDVDPWKVPVRVSEIARDDVIVLSRFCWERMCDHCDELPRHKTVVDKATMNCSVPLAPFPVFMQVRTILVPLMKCYRWPCVSA